MSSKRDRRRGGAAAPRPARVCMCSRSSIAGSNPAAALLRSVFNRVVRSLSGASARRAVCHRGRTWKFAASSSRIRLPRRSACARRGWSSARNKWAREAALKLTGFATSVIACKCEGH